MPVQALPAWQEQDREVIVIAAEDQGFPWGIADSSLRSE